VSTLPVLRAIGVTVALGVASNFVLALALQERKKKNSGTR
jgi:predicted exporter